MMTVLKVHRRLCLNEQPVPVEQITLSFVDPYQLAEDDPEADLPVTLVSFQATMKAHWLQGPLGLPDKWWIQHHAEVPLLNEILQLIKDKKPQQGSQLLMPRHHKCLLPLQIRGKTLWFENNSRHVKLALRQDCQEQVLLWFLQELQTDMLALDIEGAVPEQPHDQDLDSQQDLQPESPHEPDLIQDLIDKVLKKMLEHEQCASVNFQKSRQSFRITRKDKVFKRFRVSKLKKKLAQALNKNTKESLQQVFDLAQDAGEEFLNSSMVH